MFLHVAELKADTASQPAMRRSLTKKEIIRKKQDINRIFMEGKKETIYGMRLIASSNDLPFDRIIVIPAKHYGRAVDRNLVRRRAKEIFRCYPGRLTEENPAQGKGRDFALVIYPGKVFSFSLLESSFTKLLDRFSRR